MHTLATSPHAASTENEVRPAAAPVPPAARRANVLGETELIARQRWRSEVLELVREELRRSPARGDQQPLRRIIAERDGRLTFIDPQDIDCVEADRNYVRIHVGRETFRLRATMSQAEAMLDAGCFLRIHRSVIVNSLKIREMRRWFHGEYIITLANDLRLTSGRVFRRRIRAYLKRGVR